MGVSAIGNSVCVGVDVVIDRYIEIRGGPGRPLIGCLVGKLVGWFVALANASAMLCRTAEKD